MIARRISRDSFFSFIEERVSSTDLSQTGSIFMDRFFPGCPDPDITEESDFDRVTSLIDERYVAQKEV